MLNDVASIFSATYNGKPNALTPHVDSYGSTKEYVWELSHGSGFNHERLWAVTVLWKNGERTKLSQGGFKSQALARVYISELGDE